MNNYNIKNHCNNFNFNQQPLGSKHNNILPISQRTPEIAFAGIVEVPNIGKEKTTDNQTFESLTQKVENILKEALTSIKEKKYIQAVLNIENGLNIQCLDQKSRARLYLTRAEAYYFLDKFKESFFTINKKIQNLDLLSPYLQTKALEIQIHALLKLSKNTKNEEYKVQAYKIFSTKLIEMQLSEPNLQKKFIESIEHLFNVFFPKKVLEESDMEILQDLTKKPEIIMKKNFLLQKIKHQNLIEPFAEKYLAFIEKTINIGNAGFAVSSIYNFLNLKNLNDSSFNIFRASLYRQLEKIYMNQNNVQKAISVSRTAEKIEGRFDYNEKRKRIRENSEEDLPLINKKQKVETSSFNAETDTTMRSEKANPIEELNSTEEETEEEISSDEE